MAARPTRSLERELQSLTSRLQSLEMRGRGGAGRSRARGRRGRSGRNRSRSRSRGREVYPQAGLSMAPRSAVVMANDLGSARLSGRELLATCKVKEKKDLAVSVWGTSPGQPKASDPAGTSWLRHKKLGSLFSRYRFNRISLEWVPRVAISTPGTVHMAFDASGGLDNVAETEEGFGKIASFTASVGTAIYQRATVQCPKQYLHALNWYQVDTTTTGAEMIAAPVYIFWGVATSTMTAETTVGELWVNYEAEYTGFDA